MKPSVATALELARNALYSQQVAILRDIRDLQDSIDKSHSADSEVDSYIIDQVAEYKTKLAEVMVARETLYSVETSGL